MSKVTSTWYDTNESIILIKFERGWKWDEVIDNNHQINALIETKMHIVDSIIDVNHTAVPINSSALSQIMSMARKSPENAGKVYIINALSFGMKIMEIFSQIARPWADKIIICKTIDEALADINERKVSVS